jgi:hypothetical protein
MFLPFIKFFQIKKNLKKLIYKLRIGFILIAIKTLQTYLKKISGMRIPEQDFKNSEKPNKKRRGGGG